MEKIGIIAITYPGAFVFTRKLCEEMERERGKDNILPLSISMRPFKDYLNAAGERDYLNRWADLMLESAEELIAGGATVLCCPANTNHLALSHFLPKLSVEFVSILDAVRTEVEEGNYRKVGILGTRRTVESKMFDTELKTIGVEVLRTSKNFIDELDAVILEELVSDTVSERARRVIRSGVEELVAMGSECVLSCCTELPLVLSQMTEVPVIDSTDALSRAVVRRVSC